MDHIYTIPVKEAFQATSADPAIGCPLCLLRREEEDRQLDLILGASMMEPDIRIETNHRGFCSAHLRAMYGRRNRLGLALMLETHLDAVSDELRESALTKKSPLAAARPLSYLLALEEDCYLCARVSRSLNAMTETAVLLFAGDADFHALFAGQTSFCLPHFRALTEYAKKKLPKKTFSEFWGTLSDIEEKHLAKLREDVHWFTKKFDYQNADEPWYDAKDAVERAIRTLSGEEEKEGKPT